MISKILNRADPIDVLVVVVVAGLGYWAFGWIGAGGGALLMTGIYGAMEVYYMQSRDKMEKVENEILEDGDA